MNTMTPVCVGGTYELGALPLPIVYFVQKIINEERVGHISYIEKR